MVLHDCNQEKDEAKVQTHFFCAESSELGLTGFEGSIVSEAQSETDFMLEARHFIHAALGMLDMEFVVVGIGGIDVVWAATAAV